ncbi:MAG: DNA methyltransferase [Chloroflexota bacterium]|nr:DNA methyltransferase [Chloroflexota bacterium]
MKNALYFGDNLEWLRDRTRFPDSSVDLIYLDPPFNSKANYNKIFNEPGGAESQAQIRAFDDTWDWESTSSGEALDQLAKAGEAESASLVEWVARKGDAYSTSMAAYLAMMGLRLVEMRRVLKPAGSIYLHCDPTASHYLKLLMDSLFGPENFRNEIIWKRTSGHSDAQRYGRVHDVILYYGKRDSPTWNITYQDYEESYVMQYYRYEDPDGRKWMSADLGAAGLSGGGYEYEWKGITRVWRVPKSTMERLEREGKIFYTRNGVPRLKRYLDEAKGLPTQDVWADVEALRSWHKERLGWPTQKPEGLLERIIKSSSNEGDMVLDPFCGCGTAIIAAHRLKRHWIGIDVTYFAIDLIEDRLRRTFPASSQDAYEVHGSPTDEASARRLMERRNKQFEIWAVTKLVGAHPREHDGGVDGVYALVEGASARKVTKVIVQVKGGKHLNPGMVRDLFGTVENEKAVMGLLITLEEPTSGMKELAAHSGFYRSPASGKEYQRIQILTVKELLEEGKKFDLPAGKRPD